MIRTTAITAIITAAVPAIAAVFPEVLPAGGGGGGLVVVGGSVEVVVEVGGGC